MIIGEGRARIGDDDHPDRGDDEGSISNLVSGLQQSH